MQIFHPWHLHHPLFLSDEAKFEDDCSICKKGFEGDPFYACVDCKYYVHKSCAQLPVRIQHHFHQPHRLSLCFGHEFACDSCHKIFENELSFRCTDCNFDLDVKCALMTDIDPEGKEFITHFTHQHPLTICSKDGDNPPNCFACKKTSSDLIYGCTPCNYFLHKSCSQMSTHVLHAMHPQHALSLGVKFGHCNNCGITDYTWNYYCRFCNFYLDFSCWIESAEDAQNSERSCFLCGKQHLDSDSCIDSLYFINQSCIQLPKEIQHQFHSHKPLVLSGSKGFGCDSCHKWFDSQPHYGCEECNFRMDVKCALMPSIQYEESDESIWPAVPRHFNHQHPLQLISEVDNINCSACHTTKVSPIYGCIKCEYFLHQSCLELPIQIEHPLHDSHVLTIQPLRDNFCQICCKKYIGFSFGCIHCLFFIGIECILELQQVVVHKYHPFVEHKHHHHLLCLIEKSYSDRCNAENTFCHLSQESSEFKLTKSYSLRCIQCDYNLHLLCGPLPCTIKHKSHLHDLKLVDSIVEDDSNEYYCDICEKERNPRLCVYYCEDCKFFCHVHCVISEIINVFKKNLKKIELKIVGDLKLEGNINPSDDNLTTAPLLDFLKCLDVNDMEKLSDYFPDRKLFLREEYPWEMLQEKSSPENNTGSFLDEFFFYNEDYDSKFWGKFLEKLESFKPDIEYYIQPDEYKLSVIEVKGYKVTSNFVSLFEALLDKYGDFGHHSDNTKNVKSVMIYFLCRIVDEMRRTYIDDVTEKQLFNWFYYIKGILNSDLDLEFLNPVMEKLLESYFGLQAMKFENEATVRLDLEIVEVQEKIDELENKKKNLKLYRQEFRPGEMAKKWECVEERMTLAKQLRHKTVGEGIV